MSSSPYFPSIPRLVCVFPSFPAHLLPHFFRASAPSPPLLIAFAAPFLFRHPLPSFPALFSRAVRGLLTEPVSCFQSCRLCRSLRLPACASSSRFSPCAVLLPPKAFRGGPPSHAFCRKSLPQKAVTRVLRASSRHALLPATRLSSAFPCQAAARKRKPPPLLRNARALSFAKKNASARPGGATAQKRRLRRDTPPYKKKPDRRKSFRNVRLLKFRP